MPDIAKVLREEIARLARRQVRTALSPLKRDNVRLKKSVGELRRQIAALSRANHELVKTVTPVMEARAIEEATRSADQLRPTSKSLKRLRDRLGLTQVQFGQLLGVSGQAVVQWASKEGRVRMRATTLSALARIKDIGRREALRRLEGAAESAPVKHRKRRK
jgi:DNA-binding transcriptional regulator YiaG